MILLRVWGNNRSKGSRELRDVPPGSAVIDLPAFSSRISSLIEQVAAAPDEGAPPNTLETPLPPP
jgi:hypothetical protein